MFFFTASCVLRIRGLKDDSTESIKVNMKWNAFFEPFVDFLYNCWKTKKLWSYTHFSAWTTELGLVLWDFYCLIADEYFCACMQLKTGMTVTEIAILEKFHHKQYDEFILNRNISRMKIQRTPGFWLRPFAFVPRQFLHHSEQTTLQWKNQFKIQNDR